jgi:hypothetical protein
MNVTPVESTTLATVGYDDESARLQLEFCNRAIYQYFDVPSAVHKALLTAASKGNYFNTTIRGRYRFARVEALPSAAARPAPAGGERSQGEAWPAR